MGVASSGRFSRAQASPRLGVSRQARSISFLAMGWKGAGFSSTGTHRSLAMENAVSSVSGCNSHVKTSISAPVNKPAESYRSWGESSLEAPGKTVTVFSPPSAV